MKLIALSFMLLTFAFGTASGLAAERTLTVTLHNGTAGATVPAGTTVRLEVTRAGQQLSEQVSQTDNRGQAVFSTPPVEDDLTFQLMAEYQEVKYPSEVLSYSPGETVKNVEITVYEATDDPADLVATMAHLFFKPEGQYVLVEEMALISNEADRTYVGKRTEGGSRKTLRFTLPSAATDIEVGNGLMTCCIIVQDNVIVDSMEVLPGTKEVSFSYRLPIGGLTTLDIERPLDLPIEQAVLVAERARLEPVTKNLAPVEAAANDGQLMARVLRGTQLRAGDVLKMQLAGLPEPPSMAQQLPAGLLASGALMVIAVAIMLVSRRRTVSVPKERPQDLAQAIAKLDLRFGVGEIEAAAYERDRALLKSKLVRLLEVEDQTS
jgi:hypothetical protein